MERPWESSAATYAQVVPDGPHWGSLGGLHGAELDPRTAGVLAAVLLAAAEQVSSEKLVALGASDPLDLAVLALAMAFRADDSGLMGDVFEWSVLVAINRGDPEISQLITDALILAGLPTQTPQAVLVAAEPGRIVTYSPEVGLGATLATGRPGRPPRIDNVLQKATTQTWKADLLLGSADRWVPASLKSNPRHLIPSLRAALATPYPPRVGITASPRTASGVVRDSSTGTVLVKLPVDTRFLALSKAVLRDVQDSFARHLAPPETPLRQDVSGIGLQLHRWRSRNVRYAVDVLLDIAGRAALKVGPVVAAGSDDPGAKGVVIASDPLTDGTLSGPWDLERNRAEKMVRFDPVD